MKNEKGKILAVHPVAEAFPRLTDEELENLGADIQANGLHAKLVRDKDGTLIDGRMRLEAMKRKGIEPTEDNYVTFNGQNAFEFIFRVNNKRRHNLKSQRAMVAVKVREETGRSKKSLESKDFLSLREMAEIAGVSEAGLGQATVVWNYAREHVDPVIAGAVPLDKAYEEAKDRKIAEQSKEAQLEKLRTDAPDLADLVVEERLGIKSAITELKERKEKARRECQLSTEFLRDVVQILDHRATDPKEYSRSYVENFDPGFTTEEITKERLTRCLLVLKEIVRQWKDEPNVISKRNPANNSSEI